MSFFNNNNNENVPGIIRGNPLSGLTEKVCIKAQKVFDACMKQASAENISVVFRKPCPNTYTAPLTFVSCKSVTSKGIISDLSVEPLEKNYGRVKAEVGIPLEVIYRDAHNIEGKAEGMMYLNQDVVLCLPEPAMIPYEIEAAVGCVCPQGTHASNLTFILTACTTVILKVVTEVELLVPSYGYCFIPQCQDYSEDVCSGFFELPIFPK